MYVQHTNAEVKRFADYHNSFIPTHVSLGLR